MFLEAAVVLCFYYCGKAVMTDIPYDIKYRRSFIFRLF